jgi:hypothetical protein
MVSPWNNNNWKDVPRIRVPYVVEVTVERRFGKVTYDSIDRVLVIPSQGSRAIRVGFIFAIDEHETD